MLFYDIFENIAVLIFGGENTTPSLGSSFKCAKLLFIELNLDPLVSKSTDPFIKLDLEFFNMPPCYERILLRGTWRVFISTFLGKIKLNKPSWSSYVGSSSLTDSISNYCINELLLESL